MDNVRKGSTAAIGAFRCPIWIWSASLAWWRRWTFVFRPSEPRPRL